MLLLLLAFYFQRFVAGTLILSRNRALSRAIAFIRQRNLARARSIQSSLELCHKLLWQFSDYFIRLDEYLLRKYSHYV